MNRRIFLTTGAAGLGGLSTLLGLRTVVFSGAPARPSWDGTDQEVRPAAATPTPASWSDNAITLAWLGHATVLINFYGVWILTDPALFPRIGVDLWITTVGMLRHTSCALQPSQLPSIDLVLVSHAHFDHLDTASLASIPGRPAAVMASHTADLLPRRHYSSVRELMWGDFVRIDTPRGEVDVRAIEVNHWGARLGSDTYHTWASTPAVPGRSGQASRLTFRPSISFHAPNALTERSRGSLPPRRSRRMSP